MYEGKGDGGRTDMCEGKGDGGRTDMCEGKGDGGRTDMYGGKEDSGRTVLCGANAYERKYYFNREFDGLPQGIKDELHIICVLFTEEVGGIFTIAYEGDGSVVMETDFAPEDYLYDEISSGLMVREVRRNRQELFESLGLYYRVFVLHGQMDVEG